MVGGDAHAERQPSGQNQPAESTEEGRSSLPFEKLPLAALWRTDCWGLGWEQEAREERREVKSDGGHSGWSRWMGLPLGGCW